MSDWFIQKIGFSSDKILGPLTAEQVVALFIRREINKKTPLASQEHTSNEWVLITDSVLWPAVQEAVQKQEEERQQLEQQREQEREAERIQNAEKEQLKEARLKAAQQQQQEEETQQLEQQREQEREAERIQNAEKEQLKVTRQQHKEEEREAVRKQKAEKEKQQQQLHHKKSGGLVTQIGSGETQAVQGAGTILQVMGFIAIVVGIMVIIGGLIAGANQTIGQEEAIDYAIMGVAGLLNGFLIMGIGAAMKVFGHMGQLLEQNTRTLLRILDRTNNMSDSS